MKLLLSFLIFPLTVFAENMPSTVSLRSGRILFECSKITDKKTIKAIYLAQQEYFQKAKYPRKNYGEDFLEARRELGHHFEPKKNPLDDRGTPNAVTSNFKASATYLYLHPNSNSPKLGVVTTRIMNGNTDECSKYIRNAWGGNNQSQYMGIIVSMDGQYLGSVFDDYMAYIGDFWRLPAGMPEEFSAIWCKNYKPSYKRSYNCDYPDFDMPELTIKGIVYRNDEVWYQMPFVVDGVYPWVKNKLLKKNRSDPNMIEGKVFGDLTGKKVKFLVYPDYFESSDGKTIYIVDQTLKDKFKDRSLKVLDEGTTPWRNFRVSRIEDGYIFFNVYYSMKIDTDDISSLTNNLPPLELRVSFDLVTRPNGSLRIYEITDEYASGRGTYVLKDFFGYLQEGEENLIPKDISAWDAFKSEISKLKDNHKKESLERFLKGVVWN